MKNLLLAGIIFSAAPAAADINDSGSLVMGDQGIFGGTVTVQGSKFSVGGSTLSVAMGTVTIGGRLDLSTSGIKFADGTIQTSSATGGGAGNVVLTATQTFSGANTFTSTITVAQTALNSILDYSRIVKGAWSVVAYSSFTAATSIVFSNVASSYTYRVNIKTRQNTTAAYYYLQFNSDATSTRHRWAMYALRSNGTAEDCNSQSQGDTFFLLTANFNANSLVPVGYPMRATITIDTDPLNSSTVNVTAQSATRAYGGGSNYGITATSGGEYSGGVALSGLKIGTSAGTMTGYATIEALWNPDVP